MQHAQLFVDKAALEWTDEVSGKKKYSPEILKKIYIQILNAYNM